MSVETLAFDIENADDLSELGRRLDEIGQSRIRRLALLVRVAGEYEDGSRERVRKAIAELLATRDLAARSEYVTVIGTEGATTPCGYALVDVDEPNSSSAVRLAIGLARSTPPREDEIGSAQFGLMVAEIVARAMADGGLDAADVETIVVNVPQATSGDVARRARRGRAAAALGAGVAIGSIPRDALVDDRIADDADLYTSRVQTFTGPAIDQVEVIAIGNRAGAGGDLVACNTTTQSLIDGRSIKKMLVRAGLRLDADGEVETDGRLVATIAKLGVGPGGTVAGAPTIIGRSALPPEKHVRAAMSGVIGATLHTTRIFSTVDPVQQAPLGGGTICCIIRASED